MPESFDLVEQWNFRQFRQGLRVPIGLEAWMARRVLQHFDDYHSAEAWWEANKRGFGADFVEWVEEQRSKAA